MKRWEANISYVADLVAEDEAPAATNRLEQQLESLGMRDITIVLTPYTGAGEHEWVSSQTPGVNYTICIKCMTKYVDETSAMTRCPGFSA